MTELSLFMNPRVSFEVKWGKRDVSTANRESFYILFNLTAGIYGEDKCTIHRPVSVSILQTHRILVNLDKYCAFCNHVEWLQAVRRHPSNASTGTVGYRVHVDILLWGISLVIFRFRKTRERGAQTCLTAATWRFNMTYSVSCFMFSLCILWQSCTIT